MVKFNGITRGISVVFPVVYQWRSVVKFIGITIGFQWYISSITSAFSGITSGIPVEISGKMWWY